MCQLTFSYRYLHLCSTSNMRGYCYRDSQAAKSICSGIPVHQALCCAVLREMTGDAGDIGTYMDICCLFGTPVLLKKFLRPALYAQYYFELPLYSLSLGCHQIREQSCCGRCLDQGTVSSASSYLFDRMWSSAADNVTMSLVMSHVGTMQGEHMS